jgi:hypothetical protein
MMNATTTEVLYTTGTLAKAAGACADDFAKVFESVGGEAYGWDTPVPLATVLDVAGLNAAIWALRCVPPGQEAERDRIARLFACDAAETVIHLFERDRPADRRPRDAIAVSRRFAVGAATEEERSAAWSAACSSASSAWSAEAAAWSAEAAAAWSAACSSASSAWSAAWSAACSSASSAWSAEAAAAAEAWSRSRSRLAAILRGYLAAPVAAEEDEVTP